MIGSVVKRSLGRKHDVTVLQSAEEAMTRIQSGETYDVILCDLTMPGMSGMEFYEELTRTIPDLAERMVFVTGGAFTAEARHFFSRVTRPYVHKPVTPQQLQEAIESVLSSPSA
jgi:CheY-like chemotaxis protein